MKLYLVATPWDGSEVDDIRVFKTKEEARKYIDFKVETPRNGYKQHLWIEEIDVDNFKTTEEVEKENE